MSRELTLAQIQTLLKKKMNLLAVLNRRRDGLLRKDGSLDD